jgi:hypothetical protein
MLKFILVVVVLTIIMCKPFLLFLCAAVGLAWLLFTHPNSLTWLPAHLTTPEPKEEKSVPKKERPTVEEIYAREVEAKMKPGYKDDPKWKALDAKVRAHNAKQAGIDIKEDKLEALTNEVI